MAVIPTRMQSRSVRRLAGAALAATLLAGMFPAGSAAAEVPISASTPAGPTNPALDSRDPAPAPAASGPDGGAPPEDGPSVAYEEWLAHESEPIDFTPGARVTVPFTPRGDDRWPVGGSAPVALPTGRSSGRDMATMPTGTDWTDVGGVRGAGPKRDGAIQGDGGPDSALTAALTEAAPAPSDDPISGSPADAAAASFVEQPAGPTLDPAAARGLRRQVFGFLPYWEVRGAASRLQYGLLSTIAYFSVGATADGSLRKKDADGTPTTGWGGWTSAAMTQVIDAAHRKGTRVVLTVSAFAWTSSQAAIQRALLGRASARLTLARQIVAAVRDRGADGVNLDFEPLASGYADEFVALLRTIRRELNRVHRGYQLTYDTTASIGNYPLEASVGSAGADAVFVMGYDYRISSSSTSGSVDPLSGTGYDLADTVRAFRARIPASRIILGFPWYGRAWSTDGPAPRARNVSGQKFGYSTAVNYENVLASVRRYGRRWDALEQSAYVAFRFRNCTRAAGCVTTWRQIYYDDALAMRRRYQLVTDYGLRGAGLWALGYDGGRAEVYRALNDAFLADTSAPAAGIRALPSSEGDEGFIVSWAATDASPIVSYDVQVSVNGGRWTGWLTGTKATSEVYAGADGRRYAFRVRARDSRGNTGGWSVGSNWEQAPALRAGGFGQVVLDGLSYRAGPDASAMKLGALRAGTLLALTRGPVSADGYTWYEATGPVREWLPVSQVERGIWVAVAKGRDALVRPVVAPNSTIVRAGLHGLDFGPATGRSAIGTAPAQVAVRSFSPNRDRSSDGIVLRWTNAVALASLRANVFRLDGSLVGSIPLAARAAGNRSWTWDGTVGGRRVRDGRYVLQLAGTANGRTWTLPSARPVTPSQVARYAVVVDTTPPAVRGVDVTSQLLSPNGDGVRDATRISITAGTDATRWAIRITDARGAVVRAVSGTGGSGTFTWSGTGVRGARVADGTYTASATAFDAAGNGAGRSWPVTVDTRAPAVTPVVSAPAFSPNGDGDADTVDLSFTATEKGFGTVGVYRGSRPVRTWRVADVTTWTVAWDGRGSDRKPAADGPYTFRVDIRDAAGNRRVSSSTVVVDRTASRVRWSGDFFPQDRDRLAPTSTVSWRLARAATTSLWIYDTSGALVRTVWTRRAQGSGAPSWRWDGTRADGSLVPQGQYVARLRVRSPLATLELRSAVWASGFVITPSATRLRPGQTLTVRFRSVEPLTSAPRVTFAQPGRGGVTGTARQLPSGTWKISFPVRAGGSGSASVTVSATDAAGGANGTRIGLRIAS